MKQRILYLMHLPWGWVKQRPHFLAEHLVPYFDIDLFYRFYYVPFEGRLVRNAVQGGLRVIPFPVLPFNRFGWVADINALLIRTFLRRRISSYDIVWVTNPDMYEIVRPIISDNVRVVYDCMDNHLEFSLIKNNRQLYRRMQGAEWQLMREAQTVIASSGTLAQALVERYGLNRRIDIVNNAIFLSDSMQTQLERSVEDRIAAAQFKLVYIGTVASWMDMELLEAAVTKHNSVTIFLFGPSEASIPSHERIVHLGPIQHSQIYRVLDLADALFMPFKLDELIRGVNPVKLYEYIYSGKPTISVRYYESEKFSDYVHLYTGRDEFLMLLDELISGTLKAKKALDQCRDFAIANTWEVRAEQVSQLLDATSDP